MLTNYVIKILNYNYANNAAINRAAWTALILVNTSLCMFEWERL